MRQEGFRGLYRGLDLTLMAVVPARCLFFDFEITPSRYIILLSILYSLIEIFALGNPLLVTGDKHFHYLDRSIHFLVYGTAKKELGRLLPEKSYWMIPILSSALAGTHFTNLFDGERHASLDINLAVNYALSGIEVFSNVELGATVVTALCPLWTVKTRIQLQVSAKKETVRDGFHFRSYLLKS